MKKRNYLLWFLLYTLLVNTLYGVNFKTTVVKPVNNLGKIYFTNKIAGFDSTFVPNDTTDSVEGEIGTYAKQVSTSGTITADRLRVNDSILDKEDDTLRYKLIGLNGTNEAEIMTQNCNFSPCKFQDLPLSGDAELEYTYSRQYKLEVKTSHELNGLKPQIVVEHNNVQSNSISTDKKFLKIAFTFKSTTYTKKEMFFNITALNQNRNDHIMLTIDDRELYLYSINESSHNYWGRWVLSSSQKNKLTDGKEHKLILDIGNKFLSIDGTTVTFPYQNFGGINTILRGKAFIGKIPKDENAKLFPTWLNNYSGTISKFTIFGKNSASTSSHAVNVPKENLNIKFKTASRIWKANDKFLDFHQESADPDNSLHLYMSDDNTIALSKGGEASEYIIGSSLNNRATTIEIRIKQEMEKKYSTKIYYTTQSIRRYYYWNRTKSIRNTVLNDTKECLRDSKKWIESTVTSMIYSTSIVQGDTRYHQLYITPPHKMTEKEIREYKECISRFNEWDNSHTRTVSVRHELKVPKYVPVSDNKNERTAEIRINGGTWKEFSKSKDLTNFLEGGTKLNKTLIVPGTEYLGNVKINDTAYTNLGTEKTIYRKQDPSLLAAKDEYWINEGDSVTLFAPLKTLGGLTIESSSFTKPQTAPTGNNLVKVTRDAEEYYLIKLTDNMRPSDSGIVDWNYGGKVYSFRSIIGEPFSLDLATIYTDTSGDKMKVMEQVDSKFLDALVSASPSSVLAVKDAPSGTISTNTFVYSPLNPIIDNNLTRDLYKGQLFFTRPGTYLLKWDLDTSKFPINASGKQELVIEVKVEWPEKPDYYHIAETNDVDLDRIPTDTSFFKEVRLSEEYAHTKSQFTIRKKNDYTDQNVKYYKNWNKDSDDRDKRTNKIKECLLDYKWSEVDINNTVTRFSDTYVEKGWVYNTTVKRYWIQLKAPSVLTTTEVEQYIGCKGKYDSWDEELDLTIKVRNEGTIREEKGEYEQIIAPVSDIKEKENKFFSFPVWNSKKRGNIYRSVLLFTEANDIMATGDLSTEEVKVRVVESRHWSNPRDEYPLVDKNIIIGEEIVDGNHTVSGHTGCILKSKALEKALYNPNTYNPETMIGNIFAVNTEGANSSTDGENDLVVAWYKEYQESNVQWPYRAMRYTPQWPDINHTKRIVVASRLGTDGLDTLHKRQFKLDPAKYSKFKVYNQADKNKVGYNPNEEHAFIAPSFYHSTKTPRPQAVFALRNDLNTVEIVDKNYTSMPYVLLEYMENNSSEYKMAIYDVQIEDNETTDSHDSYIVDKNSDGKVNALDGNGSFPYTFNYPMLAGDKVTAPYPLNTVIGANKINEISGSNDDTNRNVYWEDKDGNSWAIAGGGKFNTEFYYPLLPSFWHPSAKVGKIIPFSSEKLILNKVIYSTYWKTAIPELRMGETLTFAGGEEKKDNTQAKGLPSAVAWASAEVIFDSINQKQNSRRWLNDYSVRIRPVVREIKVELANKDFPTADLGPASKLTVNKAGKWFFQELHAGLKQRIYYDEGSGKIVLRGILNDKFAGDKQLTASPNGYNYILQPNVLTIDDLTKLRDIKGSNPKLKQAFTQLYALSLDPTLSKSDLKSVTFTVVNEVVKVAINKGKIKPTTYKSLEKTREMTIAIAKDKRLSAIATRAKYPAITINVGDSDVSALMKQVEGSKDLLLHKNLTYDKNQRTLTLKPKLKDDGNTAKKISDVIYLKDADLKIFSNYTNSIPELLHLYALVVHPGFSDFDSLRLKESTSFEVEVKNKVIIDGKDNIEVEYTVGLTRFLRDKNNRFLVTKKIDSNETTLALPNGVFPAGLDVNDLEPVDEKELPYGVTIVDVTTRLALAKSGYKLVRIKEGKGYIPASSLGVGLGVLTNANLAKPKSDFKSSHIVIAENNDPLITGSPIVLHIFKVNNRPYRGQIKTIWSENAFDEKITLRHTGDFGANVKDLIFQWWYRETDNMEIPPYIYIDPSCSKPTVPSVSPHPDKWKIFTDTSSNELVFGKTTGSEVLVDNSFYVRYRHKDNKKPNYKWSGWAGSGGNRPCNQPQPVYKSQLVEGWVKRVTEKVNVYDSRISDFSKDAPASYVSMIRQVGSPYVGDVALNPDKNVIENVGLAELYQTVLNRASNLSIDAGQPTTTVGVVQALQNASSRISKFYTLLGNEAYSDALDPTIGFSTDERTYGELAPTIYSFMNQLSSLNEEEIVLLRGKEGSQEGDTGAAPVHNRLLWNFTNNDGEAAYALSYNIKDENTDGFINYKDAKIMYPQGHGDAWGHYLSATRGYYKLLQHKQFFWVSRAEKYAIDGITLDIDYLDERTFIEAAAYKSKVGVEILDLTYKSLYEEDPEAQWKGYKDTEAYRAWGVDGWVKRTHIGAYCDWVMGNAMLPEKDNNASHKPIQKIDRETVAELQDIAINGNAILTKIVEIDKGLNPLGLLPDVVPFDIDPTSGESHFEQVYTRAEKALKSAKNVFDYANSIKKNLRQVADTQADFKEEVVAQDREYRNRLVELFGTPYEGIIGAGKSYPEGYEGPDVNFYNYIDVGDLSEKNLPKQDTNLVVYLKTLNVKSYSNKTQAQNLFYKYFDGDFPKGFTADLGVPGTENLSYPLTKGPYSFNAPSYWEQRRIPGALQLALVDIVKADVDLHLANKAYTGLIDDLRRVERNIKAEVNLKNSKIKMNDKLVKNVITNSLIINGLEAFIGGTELLKESAKGMTAAAIEALPKSNGTSNDVTSVGRATIETSSSILQGAFSTYQVAAQGAIKITETAKEVADIKASKIEINADAKYAIKQHLFELDNLFDSEPEHRLAVFKAREVVRQAAMKYRGVLGKALHLLEERIAFNKKVASKTQGKRYQDMAFRLNRNAASEKYKASFNMAAKYAYLAAKAYDYETNLSPKHAASAQHILKDIVQASTLGSFVDGARIGQGGLADILARLKVNFDVLKTQMGFNNPQTELEPFSLRKELFRIKDDDNVSWEKTLKKHYVEDIWNLAEFRVHMRPFAPESSGKQPGLVIPFSTNIKSGYNFFGHRLSADDHAYDASQFSTRIKSVGIWLKGYKNLGLAETTRAYLVPVGQDTMYVPDSNELHTRQWNVKDQKIPVPLPFGKADMEKPSWTPSLSLDGEEGLLRRHSRLRVYNDSGEVDQSKMQGDSRLFGRSVWNNKWLLVIPGESLLNPAKEGLEILIHGKRIPTKGSTTKRDGHGISDIKLIFSTYSYSGN
jgi:hypothetical protein